MSRYHVSSSEGLYEKGSGEQVLANKLGIATSDEMDEAELVLLEQLYQSVFEEQFPEGQLSVAMLKSWHRRWLGNIYEWAGQERAVNISKGGPLSAVAKTAERVRHEVSGSIHAMQRNGRRTTHHRYRNNPCRANTYPSIQRGKRTPVATASRRDGRSGRIQTAGLSKLGAKQIPVYLGYPCRHINGLRADETLG